MDDWHSRLARDLIAETPARTPSDGAVAMEVSFGRARAAIGYALGIAQAHRFPSGGRVEGDDVWFRFGEGQVRVTLNRRREHIVVDVHVPGAAAPRHDEKRLGWKGGSLVDERGTVVDLGELTRSSIDVVVADWRARPASERKLPSAPPPDLEDEPTKT